MIARLQNWIEKTSLWVAAGFGALICGGLGIASLFVLSYMRVDEFGRGDMPQRLIIGLRNFPAALLGALLLVGLLLILAVFWQKRLDWAKAQKISLAAAVILMLLCAWWMNSFVNTPQADQMTVWQIAEVLAGKTHINGELTGYVQMYPFQAGMAMAMEPFVRLFGSAWGSWQILNTLCVGGCVWLLCCICGRISSSPTAKSLCAVLLVGFAPLAMYSTFIYGTLPGMMLAFLGIYAVMRESTAEKSCFWWAISVFSFGAAITLYSGEQIFLLAAGIVLLVAGILQRSGRYKIFGALLLLLLAVGFSKVWQTIALGRLGVQDAQGIPILARFAMGMDAFTTERAGFYNCLTVNIFQKCNYDAAQTSHEALQHIRNSLLALWEEKRFFAFFGTKTSDQWLDPWFSALAMTDSSLYDHPAWLARGITGGKLFAPLLAWLSTLLTSVYLAAAAWQTAMLQKEKKELWRLLLSVCLIGGFLFQVASEAKSRYCMPYYLCCFPMAAAGIAALAEKLGQCLQKRKAAQK